jgi:hypothetical protein
VWTDTIAVNPWSPKALPKAGKLLFLPDKLAGDIRGTISILDLLIDKVA